MNKIKSALRAIGMTKWFIVTSWDYMNGSRLEYFMRLFPAWFGFTLLAYKDFKEVRHE